MSESEAFDVDDIENEELEGQEDQSEGDDSPSEEAKPSVDSGYIDFDQLPEDIRDKVKTRINTDFRHQKELERKAQEAERKLREYEEQLLELKKPKEVAPPTQDEWITDPEAAAQKMQAWKAAEEAKSDWQRQADERKKQMEQAQQAAQAEIDRAYFERAENAKIDKGKLQYAGTLVGQALQASPNGPQVADFLLKHEHGPQLVEKLASDQAVLTEIASLSPYEAVVKLDRMSDQFKRRTKSSAPPPDDPLQGGGVKLEDEAYKGMTFE